MSYVPNFANDIFISYAHIDNSREWVSKFHSYLQDRLLQLGVECEIWRDSKLNGFDDFSDSNFENLKNSALLITIISPQGMKSRWCLEERQKFEQYAERTGGFRIGDTLRTVKVTKTPLADDAHRDLFGTLGFEFYQRDPYTNRVREFDVSDEEFWEVLDDLAQEIKRVLDELRSYNGSSGKTGVPVAERKTELPFKRDSSLPQARDFVSSVDAEVAQYRDDAARHRQAATGIFLSYRREDSKAHAGRICDHLADHFGAEHVFFDIDSIPAGEDFVDYLQSQISACDIMVVVIGPDWLKASDGDDRRRLDDPLDFVRLEIAQALVRKIPIFPVLVDGAEMPRAVDLPDDLAPFSRKQATRLNYEGYRNQVTSLILIIKEKRRNLEAKRHVELQAK